MASSILCAANVVIVCSRLKVVLTVLPAVADTLYHEHVHKIVIIVRVKCLNCTQVIQICFCMHYREISCQLMVQSLIYPFCIVAFSFLLWSCMAKIFWDKNTPIIMNGLMYHRLRVLCKNGRNISWKFLFLLIINWAYSVN